jgi:hypothetical protein
MTVAELTGVEVRVDHTKSARIGPHQTAFAVAPKSCAETLYAVCIQRAARVFNGLVGLCGVTIHLQEPSYLGVGYSCQPALRTIWSRAPSVDVRMSCLRQTRWHSFGT